MRTRTLLGILVGVLFVALLLWLGIYAYDNINVGSGAQVVFQRPQPATMTAFLVAWPNFIVDGSNLGRVEIWAVPVSKNEILESDYLLIGSAALQAGVDPLLQIWSLPIPPEPIPSTEIFAKAFDAQGDLVGQMSLPYLGVTQISNAVWLNAPRATSSIPDTQRHFSFGLRIGEEAVAGGLTVELLEIESDNRCPRTAVCIWAGEVAARVRLTAGRRDEAVTLHSMSSPSVFDGYQIGITGVTPARSGRPPAQDEYRVTFSVERM